MGYLGLVIVAITPLALAWAWYLFLTCSFELYPSGEMNIYQLVGFGLFMTVSTLYTLPRWFYIVQSCWHDWKNTSSDKTGLLTYIIGFAVLVLIQIGVFLFTMVTLYYRGEWSFYYTCASLVLVGINGYTLYNWVKLVQIYNRDGQCWHCQHGINPNAHGIPNDNHPPLDHAHAHAH